MDISNFNKYIKYKQKYMEMKKKIELFKTSNQTTFSGLNRDNNMNGGIGSFYLHDNYDYDEKKKNLIHHMILHNKYNNNFEESIDKVLNVHYKALEHYMDFENEKLNIDFIEDMRYNIFDDTIKIHEKDENYDIFTIKDDQFLHLDNLNYYISSSINKKTGGGDIYFLKRKNSKIDLPENLVMKIIELPKIDVHDNTYYNYGQLEFAIYGDYKDKISDSKIYYVDNETFLERNSSDKTVEEIYPYKLWCGKGKDYRGALYKKSDNFFNDIIIYTIAKFIEKGTGQNLNFIKYINVFCTKMISGTKESHVGVILMDKVDSSLEVFLEKSLNFGISSVLYNNEKNKKKAYALYNEFILHILKFVRPTLDLLKYHTFFNHTDMKVENIFFKETEIKSSELENIVNSSNKKKLYSIVTHQAKTDSDDNISVIDTFDFKNVTDTLSAFVKQGDNKEFDEFLKKFENLTNDKQMIESFNKTNNTEVFSLNFEDYIYNLKSLKEITSKLIENSLSVDKYTKQFFEFLGYKVDNLRLLLKIQEVYLKIIGDVNNNIGHLRQMIENIKNEKKVEISKIMVETNSQKMTLQTYVDEFENLINKLKIDNIKLPLEVKNLYIDGFFSNSGIPDYENTLKIILKQISELLKKYNSEYDLFGRIKKKYYDEITKNEFHENISWRYLFEKTYGFSYPENLNELLSNDINYVVKFVNNEEHRVILVKNEPTYKISIEDFNTKIKLIYSKYCEYVNIKKSLNYLDDLFIERDKLENEYKKIIKELEQIKKLPETFETGYDKCLAEIPTEITIFEEYINKRKNLGDFKNFSEKMNNMINNKKTFFLPVIKFLFIDNNNKQDLYVIRFNRTLEQTGLSSPTFTKLNCFIADFDKSSMTFRGTRFYNDWKKSHVSTLSSLQEFMARSYSGVNKKFTKIDNEQYYIPTMFNYLGKPTEAYYMRYIFEPYVMIWDLQSLIFSFICNSCTDIPADNYDNHIKNIIGKNFSFIIGLIKPPFYYGGDYSLMLKPIREQYSNYHIDHNQYSFRHTYDFFDKNLINENIDNFKIKVDTIVLTSNKKKLALSLFFNPQQTIKNYNFNKVTQKISLHVVGCNDTLNTYNEFIKKNKDIEIDIDAIIPKTLVILYDGRSASSFSIGNYPVCLTNRYSGNNYLYEWDWAYSDDMINLINTYTTYVKNSKKK